MKNEILDLEKLILKHKELYYSGKAEISDEKYDQLEMKLKKLDPENPVLSIVGHKLASFSDKVEHQKKMLSLDKTYSEDDLQKWAEKHKTLSIYKIDGSSCSLLYENGHLVMAKTRGDGQFGENITAKAMFIPTIPKSISFKGSLEVRGEVYCVEQDFYHLSETMKELKLEAPTSMRNIVAGLLGRKENIHLCRYLSFKAFDFVSSDSKFKFEHEKMDMLSKNGFEIPDYKLHDSFKSIKAHLDECKEFMDKGDYLIDGLVLVYDSLNEQRELGETAHHPRYKIAFKFAGDTKITQIKELDWGVSRNGILTPVANVEPVELSGAMISRVTLHNMGLVRNFELKVGDKIEIIRSGEVIPKFLSVSERSPQGEFHLPENCPSCQSKLVMDDIWLMCINEACPAKVKEEILNYIKKSGMEDISDKRLEEMISKGLVTDIPSLYKVTMMDLLTLEKVKDKLATKMFNEIQKTKSQSLVQFISAIGIEGISATKCEKIIANGYNTLQKMMELDVETMMKIESFAEKSSTDFVKAMKKKNKLIKTLLKMGVEVKADAVATGEGPLKGFKFCITGELSHPRAEIEKSIKMNGGVMVSSVSKNTSYLVTNEKESSSSKFVKAKELKVPVITEEELLQMMKG